MSGLSVLFIGPFVVTYTIRFPGIDWKWVVIYFVRGFVVIQYDPWQVLMVLMMI